MTQRAKSVLFQVAAVVLGAGLLYLALRPVSFEELGSVLGAANYWYLAPLAVAALGSHLARAWRWLLLLDALPGSERRQRGALRTAFYSVMIGYMVNYAAPRLGEVARAGNQAAQTGRSFSALFGTVVVERVLDVATLAVGVALAFGIAAPQMTALMPLIGDAAGGVSVSPAAIAMIAGLAVLGLAAAVVLVRHLRRRARQPGLAGRVGATIRAFEEGLLSLLRVPRRGALLASTAVIWACYLAMAYIPLLLLGIEGLTLADAWVLLVVGSAAMIVPAPGGLGSFHIITIQTMTALMGVTVAAASAYAVLAHGAQLILYVVVGFLCLLLQGRGVALRLRSEEAPA
jgi:glycosyltransferase 2 family protein